MSTERDHRGRFVPPPVVDEIPLSQIERLERLERDLVRASRDTYVLDSDNRADVRSLRAEMSRERLRRFYGMPSY